MSATRSSIRSSTAPPWTGRKRIGELREGIARGEFRLDYQAVVDLDRSRIIGYEALVRWEHPTAGRAPAR